MDINEFKMVKKQHEKKEQCLKHSLIAFITGGILSIIGNIIIDLIMYFSDYDVKIANTLMILIVIIVTILLTGLGYYDKLAQQCGAGLFIPISGFANSMASEAIESKHEGLIYGIGSNMFKLAGSVITYGIVSAYIVSIVRYFLKW